MGNKVNPIGVFRSNRTWDSRWYAKNTTKTTAIFFSEDRRQGLHQEKNARRLVLAVSSSNVRTRGAA
jgi:hypothetical protein